jgi:uncharacterized protein with GYD domain
MGDQTFVFTARTLAAGPAPEAAHRTDVLANDLVSAGRSSPVAAAGGYRCPNRREEREMPTYLMLTNLTAEGVRTLKNNPGRVAEVNKEVEQIGAKVLAQYATLGQYDFVTVVEAPDEKTMAKVSVELGSRGTMTSQTLTAMPAEDLAGSL